MKNRSIYTLTLDFADIGQPERKTRWVKITHREAMRMVRRYKERGDSDGSPLRAWKLDSGWQPKRPTQDEIDHYDSIDHDHVE